jgi:hypothetical protein
MQDLTKLDAVNSMLDAIGEEPVSSLDSGLSDADLALRKLEEVSRDIQAKGWNCNTEEEFVLSRNNAGEIILPLNTLKVDASGKDEDRNVTKRGNRLYDLKKHSFIFDADVTCDIVVGLEFEELPYALRNYILCRAGRILQEGAIGSLTLDQFTKRREEEAWAAWLEADSDENDTNILTASRSVSAVAWRFNRLR